MIIMEKCLLCNNTIKVKYNFNSIFQCKKTLICEECLNQLERVSNGCEICGKKTNDNICEDCLQWGIKIKNIKNISLFYYNDFAKWIVENIKFKGDLKILSAFKYEILKYFKNKNIKNIYSVPVPLHDTRYKERGFNQSLAIAKFLPYPILDILIKNNNEKQSKKTKLERISFDNQYSLIEGVDIRDKKILIVDDIYTTGATVHKIGKLLYDKNAHEVKSFTLFRS